ncbi:MAG: IS110 family transposase [Gammaproteobacteria bacterium]
MKHSATGIGLDIAKNVFYAVGMDERGHEVLKRKMTRHQVLAFFANLPAAKVGMEACASAHYWARKLNALGHDVRLIAGQHVSRRVLGNKNDYRDAKVICELRLQAQTLYVPINTEAQQDVQMLHRVRQRLVENRTALLLQIRGLLGEYGLSFPQGPTALRKGLIAVLGGEHAGLSAHALETFCHLQGQLIELEEQVDAFDQRIGRLAREDHQVAQLIKMPGIGPLTATALFASLGHAHHFPAGRNFAANLGLTPHEHSSGGKQRLFGISKRGDRYLRTLLIHGARSALRCAQDKPDRLLQWALKLKEAKGFNVAACALANKLARVAWALLAHGRRYEPQWIDQRGEAMI